MTTDLSLSAADAAALGRAFGDSVADAEQKTGKIGAAIALAFGDALKRSSDGTGAVKTERQFGSSTQGSKLGDYLPVIQKGLELFGGAGVMVSRLAGAAGGLATQLESAFRSRPTRVEDKPATKEGEAKGKAEKTFDGLAASAGRLEAAFDGLADRLNHASLSGAPSKLPGGAVSAAPVGGAAGATDAAGGAAEAAGGAAEGAAGAAGVTAGAIGLAVAGTLIVGAKVGLDALKHSVNEVIALAAKASPGAYHQLEIAYDDQQAVIGQRLVPVLKVFTESVRFVGDVLQSILPPADDFATAMEPIKEAFGDLREAIAPLAPLVKDLFHKEMVGIAIAMKEGARVLMFPLKLMQALGFLNPDGSKLESSAGAAGRSISFGDADSAAKEVYKAAFAAGSGGGKPDMTILDLWDKLSPIKAACDEVVKIMQWWQSKYNDVKPAIDTAGHIAWGAIDPFGLGPIAANIAAKMAAGMR